MKIVLLVSAMNSGGAERVAATLSNAWAARGEDVILLPTWSGRGGCDYTLDQRVRLVYLADLVNRRGAPYGGYARRLLTLRRFIRDQRPDVVISFLTNVNITAVLALTGLRLPLVVSERIDPLADAESNWAWNEARRLLYPAADSVTVQTTAGVAAMRECVPAARRIDAVPNPIPEEIFDAAGIDTRRGPRRRIVAMGRLAEQKQWNQLIQVFADLARRHEEVDLWIWGEGSLRSSLERQVKGAGLVDRVFLPGRTATPWAEMIAADVFVLSSAYEGFPNVLLEAMALSIPCVTYDCPSGPREISEDGKVAVLVPLNDKAALQRSLDDVLSDPDAAARLGRRGAESVRARYRLPAVLARWDEILDAARARWRRIPA